MISLLEASHIPATPERVWEFFRELDRSYADWHPGHLRWKTLRGEPLAQGAVWFADEWIGPMRVSGRFFITQSEPGRFFAYRVGFPHSLGHAGGSFRFVPTRTGCRLEQEVHMGFSTPIVGPLLDRLLARLLPIRELHSHMREEQANLARLLMH